jgi:hypothetical protein
MPEKSRELINKASNQPYVMNNTQIRMCNVHALQFSPTHQFHKCIYIFDNEGISHLRPTNDGCVWGLCAVCVVVWYSARCTMKMRCANNYSIAYDLLLTLRITYYLLYSTYCLLTVSIISYAFVINCGAASGSLRRRRGGARPVAADIVVVATAMIV